jgi:hypothetical protein
MIQTSQPLYLITPFLPLSEDGLREGVWDDDLAIAAYCAASREVAERLQGVGRLPWHLDGWDLREDRRRTERGATTQEETCKERVHPPEPGLWGVN